MVYKQASTCLILLMVAGCVRDYAHQIVKLEQVLSSDSPQAILQQTHPDYSDQIGDLDRLKADLEWLERAFEQRIISLSVPQEDKDRSTGVSHFLHSKAKITLDGEPSWKYQGSIRFEFVDGVTPKIRGGILTDLRDIRSLMQKRRAAIEENNPTAYGHLIHPSYANGDENKTEVQSRVSEEINKGKIRLQPQHHVLEVRESLAHLTEWMLVTQSHTQSSSTASLSPNQVKTEFTLKKSAGYWRISSLIGRF